MDSTPTNMYFNQSWQNKYITIKSDYKTMKANINVEFEVILVKHRKPLMSVQKLSVRSQMGHGKL